MADETKPSPAKKSGAAAAAEVAALQGAEKFILLRDAKFGVIAELPGLTILNLGLASDPEANQFARLRAISEVLDVAVVTADRGRFKDVLLHADPVVGIEELDGLIGQLIEQVMGRPT